MTAAAKTEHFAEAKTEHLAAAKAEHLALNGLYEIHTLTY